MKQIERARGTGLQWITASLFGAVIVVVIGGLFFFVCHHSGLATPISNDDQAALRGDQIIVQGSMTTHLALELHTLLAQPHAKINTVFLDSPGGDLDAAALISRDLADFGDHVVVIPAGRRCWSSCIFIATGPQVKFEPDDNSTLLFHRTYRRTGPENCFACRVVDRLINLELAKSSHRQMYRWAEQLAPGLGVAMARCDPSPFDTFQGIVISGRTFKTFRAGQTDTVTCPSKPDHPSSS